MIRHPRLVAYQQLIASLERARPQVGGGSLWTGFLNRLPLTLGESAADRYVMFSASDSMVETFNRAVDGLVDLIKRRVDPAYDQEKKSAMLPDESLRVTLWPKRFCPRTIPEENPFHPIVRLSLLQSPELDAGLMESWLSRPAGGQPLFETLKALISKSRLIAREQSVFSGVALMSHLAVQSTLLEAKSRIKLQSFRKVSYARLERAVGMALHATFSQAVQEALHAETLPHPATLEHNDFLVVLSSLAPLAFITIRKDTLDEDVNPYELSAEVDDLLSPVYQAGLEKDNHPQYLLEECLRVVTSQPQILHALVRQGTCQWFRRLVLDHLMSAEDPATDTDRTLANAYFHNDLLLRLLDDSSAVVETISQLRQRLEEGRQARNPLEKTNRLLVFLHRVRKDGPPWAAPSSWDASFPQDQVESFLVYRMDEFAIAHLEQAHRRLVNRRQTHPTAVLIQEYEAGRLYRIADDELPLVKARVFREEAHLFVDLKGYTRRTARVKELVMAELLQKEFYEPILKAAKKYYAGVSLVAGEENIRLVNLLGDAVAFSGNIASLVGLAHDIQKIFRDYSRKLKELAPLAEESAFHTIQHQVERQRGKILEKIERLRKELASLKQEVSRRMALNSSEMGQRLQQDFQEQFDKLQQRQLTLQARAKSTPAPDAQQDKSFQQLKLAYAQLKKQQQAALAQLKKQSGQQLANQLGNLLCQRFLKKVAEIEGEIQSLQEEDRILEDALEQERHLHLGTGLEAGLFISYGAAAELIEIDDDIWGLQRVSIGERINEAARGTARNLIVKRRLDDRLTAARTERQDPKLGLPFWVYVYDAGTLSLEPALSRLWIQASAEKNQEMLDRFTNALNQQIQRRFGGASELATNGSPQMVCDIYNLGEAMSGAALDAYLRYTHNTHFFFRVQVPTSELHPEIRKRFFFAEEGLSLIVGNRIAPSPGGVEMYRFAGQVLFRGFEVTRPTPVYEILRPESPFVRLVVDYHLSAWQAEALENPDCKLGGLVNPADTSEATV